MTRSKYWVNNMRQPHAYPKRDSQIMLETWHGTPLKKLVFDMDDVHSANLNISRLFTNSQENGTTYYQITRFQQKSFRAVLCMKKTKF